MKYTGELEFECVFTCNCEESSTYKYKGDIKIDNDFSLCNTSVNNTTSMKNVSSIHTAFEIHDSVTCGYCSFEIQDTIGCDMSYKISDDDSIDAAVAILDNGGCSDVQHIQVVVIKLHSCK